MPSGAASNVKQSTLKFLPSSQTDNPRNSQHTNASDNTDNATGEDTNNNRQRNRVENELGNDLQMDIGAVGSETSLSGADSVLTVIDRNDTGVDPVESAMADNFIEDVTDDRHKPRIIRLERMRDKADRYDSHIEFLKDCHKTKVIPKGLRIDVEPSIGNNDEDFCNKWFSRLEEFSLTLISDIISYCEQTKTGTASQIENESALLRDVLNTDDFIECMQLMDLSSEKRKKRLSMTKRKKYHFLRYNRPENRPERQPSGRDLRRQDSFPSRDNNRRRRYNDNDRHSDYLESNVRSRTDNNGTRSHQDKRAEAHSDPLTGGRPSGNRRTIQFQDEDNNDHQNFNHRANHRDRDDTRRNTNNHLGNDRQTRSNHHDRQVDQRQRDDGIPRRTTYRDILTRRSQPSSRTSSNTNLRQPSRNSSSTNLRRQTSRTGNNLRYEGNATPPRRNSDHKNIHQRDSENSEIATLRRKLAEYERGSTSSAPKNATSPSEEGATTSKKTTNQEILDYITTTMQNLEGFRRQLSN